MDKNGNATKIDIVKRFNKGIAEVSRDVSSRGADGVANISDYKLDGDEYGGDDDEVDSDVAALRRYTSNVNPENSFRGKSEICAHRGKTFGTYG